MEGNNKKSHTIIPDDNDRNHSYKSTKNSSVSEDSSTKRTKGIPTVTQATQQEDDDSSIEVESPKQDSTSFDAVNKPF